MRARLLLLRHQATYFPVKAEMYYTRARGIPNLVGFARKFSNVSLLLVQANAELSGNDSLTHGALTHHS